MARTRNAKSASPERVANSKRGMVPKYEEWPGFRVVTETGLPPSLQQVTTADFSLSAGPLIHGDFRSPNNWSYTWIRNLGGVGDTLYTSGTYFQKSTGAWQTTVIDMVEPKVSLSVVDRLALDRLTRKVRGELDLSTGIAEMGQTRKMISLSRVSVAAMAGMARFASRKRNAAYSLLAFGKAMGNKWLEYQYGWRPLLSDLYGAANESLRYSMNRLKRVNAGGSIPFGPQRMSGSSVLGPFIRRPTNFTGLYAVRYSIDILNSNELDIARWTSLNPVSIAWELMPYSFVVDWFYDVGGYLRNAETAIAYASRFQGGYKSSLSVYIRDISISQRNGPSQANVENNARVVCQFARGYLTSYPFPRPPVVQVDLGSAQLLSAAALLGQLVSGEPVRSPQISGKEARMYKKYFKNSEADFRNLSD